MRTKKTAVLAAALVAALAAAVPAAASEPGLGPVPEDLGLDTIRVTSAALPDPRTGDVVVWGTVTCSSGPLNVQLHSSVRQGAGRSPHVVEASGGSEVYCHGETAFSFAVSPERGRLRAGDAEVFAAAFAGDPLGGFDAVEASRADGAYAAALGQQSRPQRARDP